MLGRMFPQLKPSRTYRLPVLALSLYGFLAVVTVLVAWGMPEQLATVTELFGTLAMSAAGVASIGSGAIAARDVVGARGTSHVDPPEALP